MNAVLSSLTRIRAVAAKEFRQLARDKLTFAMVVGIPLMQILIFGYSINFDVRHIEAGVVDLANTTGSRAFIADLQATQVLSVTHRLGSPQELEAAIARGEFNVGVYIPPDFERRRLSHERAAAQVLVDASEPTIEGVVRGIANVLDVSAGPGGMSAYRQSRAPSSAGSGSAAAARASLSPAQTQRSIEIRTLYNPERRTAVQIVPALIGVILNMTMVVFTAIAIVRERERGNLELLITTPVKSAELMAGKLLPYIAAGLVQTTLILLVGRWLFDVPVLGSLVDLYLAAMAFIAATLMLGLLISTLVQTQFQAVQLSFFTLLPSILLSGFMFPFDGMPKAAQWIAQILPLTHFVELVRGIVLRGAPLLSMPAPLLKLLAFFAVALMLAALRFRKSLD